ncbi:MAG: hypothetical protein WCX85_03485 [Bacilli bacterium]|jgi:hypothetical protein|nr:hypothetical protein [Bacilli bacterium]
MNLKKKSIHLPRNEEKELETVIDEKPRDVDGRYASVEEIIIEGFTHDGFSSEQSGSDNPPSSKPPRKSNGQYAKAKKIDDSTKY